MAILIWLMIYLSIMQNVVSVVPPLFAHKKSPGMIDESISYQSAFYY